MSANLKALGLALLAALALSAVAAGTASAAGEEFHATEHIFEEEPEINDTGDPITHVVLDGDGDGSNQTFIANPGLEQGEVICKKLTVHGTISSEAGTTEEATVEPTYEECEVIGPPGEFKAHVEFTECDYRFTSEVEGHAPVHIECPEGQEIHVKATFLGFKIQCITIPGQTPNGGVTYTNTVTPEGKEKTDDITVEATAKDIVYTTHSNCGGPAEGYETREDATYTGNAEVWGTDTEENKVDIWWE